MRETKRSFKLSWQKLPQPFRSCLVLIVYFLGSYILDQSAIAFGRSAYVSLCYPPPALDVVLLVVGGLRYLPALFFAPYVWELLDLTHPFPTSSLGLFSWTTFFYALIKLVTFGGVSWLLKRWRFDMRLLRTRDIAYFLLLASFIASFFAALLGVTLFTIADNVPLVARDFILNVLGFWAGDATGVALLAPPLLIVFRGWLPQPTPLPFYPPLRRAKIIERVFQFLALIFAVWLGYARRSDGLLNYSYLIGILRRATMRPTPTGCTTRLFAGKALARQGRAHCHPRFDNFPKSLQSSAPCQKHCHLRYERVQVCPCH